jgi:transposase
LRRSKTAARFIADPQRIAMHQRLIAARKEHKVALVACARKLDIFANAAVGRKTAWL